MKRLLFLACIAMALTSCSKEQKGEFSQVNTKKELSTDKLARNEGELKPLRWPCDTTWYWQNEVIDDIHFQMLGIYCFPVEADSTNYILGWDPHSSRVTRMSQDLVVSLSSSTNLTTSTLSNTALNSTYPDEMVGYEARCPYITSGGLVYVKSIESGSSDVWQTITAPITP